MGSDRPPAQVTLRLTSPNPEAKINRRDPPNHFALMFLHSEFVRVSDLPL